MRLLNNCRLRQEVMFSRLLLHLCALTTLRFEPEFPRTRAFTCPVQGQIRAMQLNRRVEPIYRQIFYYNTQHRGRVWRTGNSLKFLH